MTSRRADYLSALGTMGPEMMNRRQFMRRAAALGMVIPSISTVLAACEGDIGGDEPAVESDDDEEDVDDDTDEPAVEPDDDEDDDETESQDREPDPVGIAPELDLETLEAETPDGTLQAERAENSYVGEIADGRVIGIAFLSELGATDDPYEQDEIVVHLYNRQEAALFLGEVDEEGAASLQSLEGSYFDAAVELVMEDDVVTGTVTFGDEEPSSFTADAATGVAGVYWAVGDESWEMGSADWVVLADGRQWGAVCVPFPQPDLWCMMRQ